jgi:hypothetical protein
MSASPHADPLANDCVSYRGAGLQPAADFSRLGVDLTSLARWRTEAHRRLKSAPQLSNPRFRLCQYQVDSIAASPHSSRSFVARRVRRPWMPGTRRGGSRIGVLEQDVDHCERAQRRSRRYVRNAG